jgi:hypothetical protein
MTFTPEIEKSTLKIIWKHQRCKISKIVLNKMSNIRGIKVPEFKLYYGDIPIKTA